MCSCTCANECLACLPLCDLYMWIVRLSLGLRKSCLILSKQKQDSEVCPGCCAMVAHSWGDKQVTVESGSGEAHLVGSRLQN